MIQEQNAQVADKFVIADPVNMAIIEGKASAQVCFDGAMFVTNHS